MRSSSTSPGIAPLMKIGPVRMCKAGPRSLTSRKMARVYSGTSLGETTPSVMVTEHPVRPTARRKRCLIVGDQRCEGARLPRRIDELEVEGQVHLWPFSAVIMHQPIERQVDLADQH